ncbi:unnamed protein product, partial [Didymodactylos carnosus]
MFFSSQIIILPHFLQIVDETGEEEYLKAISESSPIQSKMNDFSTEKNSLNTDDRTDVVSSRLSLNLPNNQPRQYSNMSNKTEQSNRYDERFLTPITSIMLLND